MLNWLTRKGAEAGGWVSAQKHCTVCVRTHARARTHKQMKQQPLRRHPWLEFSRQTNALLAGSKSLLINWELRDVRVHAQYTNQTAKCPLYAIRRVLKQCSMLNWGKTQRPCLNWDGRTGGKSRQWEFGVEIRSRSSPLGHFPTCCLSSLVLGHKWF